MEKLRINPQIPHDVEVPGGASNFLLGDTAWQLLHRLTRDEICIYLDNRAAKGFNLILTVFLAEFDGLRLPNAEGHVPLIDIDPTRLDPGYLEMVRFFLGQARERGIYVGLLPTWGDKMTAPWGTGPRIFDIGSEELCYRFGHELASRISDFPNVLWVLGGDRPVNLSKISPDWSYPWEAGFTPETDWEPLWASMASGIRTSYPDALFAFHPQGGSLSTSQLMSSCPWLDINMMQSGHGGGHDVPVWDWIERDYALQPIRPTLDAEPNYEDHPVNPWPTWDPANGYFEDWDVRKQCFRSVFSGACGVVYGHNSVWQFWDEGREPIMFPRFDWKAALDRPGAFGVGSLKKLIDRFGDRRRIPDTAVFVDGPGNGADRKACLRTEDGALAMVYAPNRSPFRVKLPVHGGKTTRVSWVNLIDLSEEVSTEAEPGTVISASGPFDTLPDGVLLLQQSQA